MCKYRVRNFVIWEIIVKMLSGTFGGHMSPPRRAAAMLANAVDFMQIRCFSSPTPCRNFLAVYLNFNRFTAPYEKKTRYVWSFGEIFSQASRNASPVLHPLLCVADLWILQKKCQETHPVESTVAHKCHKGCYPPWSSWSKSSCKAETATVASSLLQLRM